MRYLDEVLRRLHDLLGAPLAGVYVTGSVAFGTSVPGRSDVDVLGILDGACPPARVRAVASACSHRMLPCPARKLELVLYPLEAVRAEQPSLDWVLNLETGAGGEVVSFDPGSQARHWFVLDASIARERARPLLGPPPAEVFAPLERSRILGAILDSIAWHREREADSPNAVLNACRGWAWASTGTWMSKPAAAEWSAERTPHASTIRLALAIHRGEADASLRPDAVAAFVTDVEREIARMPV